MRASDGDEGDGDSENVGDGNGHGVADDEGVRE
jgi:hypothetical protein